MITRVDPLLVAQVERFALRFTCESCAHFDGDRQACANGYPTDPHHRPALRVGGEICFCKEFELV